MAWIFLNDAMLSVVAPDRKRLSRARARDDVLVVRARFAGDIERVFTGVEVEATAPDDHARDYAFRALVPRRVVQEAMHAEIARVDYQNFKGSVREGWRHDVYLRCWTELKTEQDKRRPRQRRGAAAPGGARGGARGEGGGGGGGWDGGDWKLPV